MIHQATAELDGGPIVAESKEVYINGWSEASKLVKEFGVEEKQIYYFFVFLQFLFYQLINLLF